MNVSQPHEFKALERGATLTFVGDPPKSLLDYCTVCGAPESDSRHAVTDYKKGHEAGFALGWRQGLANSEANNAANIAANERLRLEIRTKDIRLAFLEEQIKNLYKVTNMCLK